MLTAEDIIGKIFTSPNPQTGSQPPPQMAWVVFAHGTTFFAAPTDALPASASLAEIAQAANAALGELGPVRPGSPSADFRPVRLDGWFPDEPAWFVGFDQPDIATMVVIDAEPVAAGLEARSRRQRDHDERAIVCVRGFDGSIERTP